MTVVEIKLNHSQALFLMFALRHVLISYSVAAEPATYKQLLVSSSCIHDLRKIRAAFAASNVLISESSNVTFLDPAT